MAIQPTSLNIIFNALRDVVDQCESPPSSDVRALRLFFGLQEQSGQTELWLSDREIEVLPNEVCQLTNLTSVDLSRNQLRSLPPEIGKLRALKSINLSFNQLRTIPEEIVKLWSLHTLD